MNRVTLIKALIQNNMTKKFPDLEVTKEGSSMTFTSKVDSSEYNEISTSEWVDPYVKVDKKTNQYRKVSGYWRKATKFIRTGTIQGTASFFDLKPIEQITKMFNRNA